MGIMRWTVMAVATWSTLALAQPVDAPPLDDGPPPVEPATAVPDPAPPPPEPVHKSKKDKKRDKGKLKIGGFLQVFYKHRFDTNDDGTREAGVFRVQRARIELEGKISKRVGYDISIDPRAPEVTGILRDAFLAIAVFPHHKLRIGQQKTTFGYENLVSSSKLYTVNRAEVSDALARGKNLRDIGLGLVGKTPVAPGWTIEDAITVVNGAGLNVQADDTKKKNVWARVGARFDREELMVRGGVSGALGDQLEPDDPGPPPVTAYRFDFKRIGVDVEVDHPYFFVAAEYAMGWDTSKQNPDATGDAAGYYVQLVGKAPHDLGPVVRYDTFDEFTRYTLGAYWNGPTSKLRVLVNYEIIEDDTGPHDHKLYVWTQGRF